MTNSSRMASEDTVPDVLERLSGLCKLWGVVKYFHPYLAYRDIDWDAALVGAIPRVQAAASMQEYRDAVGALLSALDDPITRGLVGDEPEAVPRPKPGGENALPVHWTDDRIAIIDATEYERFGGNPSLELFPAAGAATRGAHARILDLRCATPSSAAWYFTYSLLATFPTFLHAPLRTSSLRHRMHSGYGAQAPGFFYSAMVTEAPATIRAGAEDGDEPFLVFLINEHAAYPVEVLAGLQASGRGAVVRVGEPGEDWGFEAHRQCWGMTLPGGIRVQIRVVELVNGDGSAGFYPHCVVSPSMGSDGSDPGLEAALELARGRGEGDMRERQPLPGALGSASELPYAEMAYPSVEYRLLALFRFWNVIHYFFPYKDLMDEPWDDVLPAFIPRFEEAADGLAYLQTVAEMVARIGDTHGSIEHPALGQLLGTHVPPLVVRTVQDQTVVTALLDHPTTASIDLHPGDIVLEVDGEPIEKRRARLAPLLAASTIQALNMRLDTLVLAGPEVEERSLTVRDATGSERVVHLGCIRLGEWWQQRGALEPSLPVFGTLAPSIGYIDLTRLTLDEIDASFQAIEGTRAVIMDMRGYPHGVFQPLSAHLTDRRVTAALFRRPEWHGPDEEWGRSMLQARQSIEPAPGEPYRGKVVVLINEQAISQSEHTCLFLEAAADATFVGSPTNGANGDVTATVLPAGIVARFSGHDVRHADGRQLQRLGIQPHIYVEPTVEGIRDGRDEVLEAAIRFIKAEVL